MKKRFIIGVIAVLFAVLAFRLFQVSRYPVANGTMLGSPDGKLSAMPSTVIDESFWGVKRQYYEFAVLDISNHFIRHVTFQDSVERPTQWRVEGSVEWAPDSSQVTFSNAEMRLILKVKP